MRFRASASALCVLALALPACSAADVESDDELATQADALGPWMAHKEVVASPHPTQGAPAWADDGAAVLGVELRYERQLQVPPLQGLWSKRNFRYQLFTQPVNGTKLGERQPFGGERAGTAAVVHYMKSQGYALVTGEEGTAIVRPNGTKLVRPRAADDHLRRVTVLPSPDGRTLAITSCAFFQEVPQADGALSIEPVRPVPCAVQFKDAATLADVSSARVELPEAEPEGPVDAPSLVTFAPSGELIVTDRKATAFAIAPGGQARAVRVPTCNGAETTSSKVGPDGALVGVRRGKLALVGAAGSELRFGCR